MQRRLGQLFEARGADNLLIMLGNALPAEKLPAFRTPRRSLAIPMIEAPLVSDGGHPLSR
jgi:hypothetical protein